MPNQIKPPTKAEMQKNIRQPVGKPPTLKEYKAGKLPVGKPPTIRQKELLKKYKTDLPTAIKLQKQETDISKIKDVNEQIAKFQEGLTYENYERRYNILSAESKKYVTSPVEVKSSIEYKQYQKAKGQQKAYEIAVENVNRKSRGQRISWHGAPRESLEIYKKLIQQPEISAAIQVGTERKSLAHELGIKNLSELPVMQRFAEQTGLKPAELEKLEQIDATKYPSLFYTPPIAQPTVTTTVIEPEQVTVPTQPVLIKKEDVGILGASNLITPPSNLNITQPFFLDESNRSSGLWSGGGIGIFGGDTSRLPSRDTPSSGFFDYFKSGRKETKEKTIKAFDEEFYTPGLGFVSAGGEPSATVQFVRHPTPGEKISFEKAQTKGEFVGRSLYGIPAQITGGFISQPMTEQQYEEFVPYSPTSQYQLFKTTHEYEEALKKAEKIEKELKNINKEYDAGKIDYSTYQARFEHYQQDPSYQKVVSDPRRTIFQRISDSKLSPGAKFGLGAGFAGAEFATFVSPFVQVARGAEFTIEGGEKYAKAETTGEKVSAGIEFGIGTALLVGGAGGLGAFGKGGTGFIPSIIKESKFVRAGGKYGVPLGIGGLTGMAVYSQTEDVPTSLGAGIGAGLGIGIPMATRRFFRDKPLYKEEIKLLESELKVLERTPMKDTTIIKEGAGTKKGSDLVTYKGIKETPSFKREITIKGDLITNKKGVFFFPEGTGTARTTGKFKFVAPEKTFVDIQSFEVGAKGIGIKLGNVGEIKIGTSIGSSTFVPKMQVSQIYKTPKTIYQNLKENFELKITSKGIQTLKERVRLKFKPKFVKKGGEITKDIKTDLKPTSFTKEFPEGRISEFGLTVGRGRIGTITKVRKPTELMGYKRTGKKTPFSKTFGVDRVTKPSELITERPPVYQKPIIKKAVVEEHPLMVGGRGISEAEIIRWKTKPLEGINIFETQFQTMGKGISKGTEASLSFLKGQPAYRGSIIPGFAPALKYKTDLLHKTKLDERTKIKEKTISGLKSFEMIKSDVKVKQDILPKQAPVSLLASKTISVTKEIKEVPSIIPLTPETLPPQAKHRTRPPRLFFPGEELVSTQGYNIEIQKINPNTQKKYWDKIELKNPLILQSALSFGARETDSEPGTEFRVKKAKRRYQQVADIAGRALGREKIKAVDTKDPYFKDNIHKFRQHDIKKGKKIPLNKGHYQERPAYRKDSPRERKSTNLLFNFGNNRQGKKRKRFTI